MRPGCGPRYSRCSQPPPSSTCGTWGRAGGPNSFYSAAVQAGTKSWKAFFFGSSDSSNFITVDKPPAFLWPMEISARIFGLNSWSVLAPQALEGVATVGLVYLSVRRWFSAQAALLGAAVVALTPVAAMMFRYNNPDAHAGAAADRRPVRHHARAWSGRRPSGSSSPGRSWASASSPR